MNKLIQGFIRLACGAFCALNVTSAFSADFVGENGSYSGDLAVDANWQPSGVPQNGTANFNSSGELTVRSPVTFSAATFAGLALEWALADFGSGNLTIQDLTVTGTGSHLLLENGTLTIDGASPHIYIGGDGNADNVLEVGRDATLKLKSGPIRIGGYRLSTTVEAPGNTLRVSAGGTLSAPVNVLLGDGNNIGNSDSRVEVQGADLFELTGSANLNIGYRAGAFASRATFYDTAKVSIAATLGVGVDSAATNCVLIASNVTDFAVGGNMTVKNKASAELRDIANLTLKNVTVGSGSSFVMDGVTALTMSGTVTAGDAAGGSYVELHPPATFDAKKAVTVAGAAGAPNVLVFDGAGRTFESAALQSFVNDNGGYGNVTVELRNGTYRLTNVNRYRPSQPNRTYVIGPDATLDANVPSFASGGNVLYLEGGSVAFGEPVEGIALVVDGGTLDFTTAPDTSGSLCLGSGGWGYGSIFEAKNNGVVKLPYDLSVGAESGIADACQVRIASGATLSARNFIVLTSNNRVTVSDATVSVAGCRWPDNNSKWPNKPTELGDKANMPREATNNVFRFEGPAARLKATGDIICYQNAGQTTDVTLEFALPADGFDNVPVEADGNITFQGKARLCVDVSAYAGAAKWLTLVKAGGIITVPDWDLFVAGIPEGVLVRFKDANRKELQVCVGNPYVFVGDAATPYSGDLGTAANWASGELPSDGDGRGDFTQSGALSADAPVSFLEACFLGSDAVWSVDTGDKWSLNKLIVGGDGADNQRVTMSAGTTLSLMANGSTAPQVTVGSAGATNNVLEFAAGSSLAMPDGAILVNGTAGADNGNVFKADGATDVSAKSLTVRNGTAAEIRDVARLSVSGDIVVTGGGSLVLSNATDLSITKVYVGSATAANDGGASAELFMPATFDPRNVYVGRQESDALRSLVYGAGGGSVSATELSKFVNDALKANVRVELRNGAYTLAGTIDAGQTYANPQRYRPTNPTRAYVIGPGATMSLPKVRYGYAFYQEGQSEAYGEPIEGIAVIVDGGVLDLLDETGGYYMGSAGWGYGGIFEVKNGGRVQATQDFVIGGESGVADACRLLVASDGELNAAAFRILTSDNRVTISNGTVSVANCYWPSTGSKYPNNVAFGDKVGTPREATNNVVRFEGACPRLVVSGAIASCQDAGQKTSTTLEFVIPEGGYDQAKPPIEATAGISFQSKLTVRIDPTAYTGVHRWMTLMKTTSGSISIADLDLSEVPDTCQVRLSADGKRLQVGLGEPRGILLLVR